MNAEIFWSFITYCCSSVEKSLISRKKARREAILHSGGAFQALRNGIVVPCCIMPSQHLFYIPNLNITSTNGTNPLILFCSVVLGTQESCNAR